MSVARAVLLAAAKEIRTGLRDRQALVSTALLPFALYPALFWVLIQGALVVDGQRERTLVRVGAAPRAAGEQTEQHEIARQDRARLSAAIMSEPEGVRAGPAEVIWDEAPKSREAAAGALHSGELDAYLLPNQSGAALELLYDGSKSRSRIARGRTEERLARLAEDARIEAAGGDANSLLPFTLEHVDVAAAAEQSAYVLSFLLPLMFCVMAILGAFFPAIDATAGEKERGTAETTLLLPVPRTALHAGKILAIAAFALLATVLNLAGLFLAGEHLLASMEGPLGFELIVPYGALGAAAPFLALFLISTSALLFAVTSFAPTFKQGQALLGVVQIVLLIPTMLVSMPGIELSPALALVPFVQTALVFKALLQHEASALELVLVAASQVAYTALALWLALRLSTSEALRLGGARPARMPKLLRAPRGLS